MTSTYIAELDLTTRKISDGGQKIEGLLLATYGMAFTKVLLKNSFRRVKFFEETLLLADTSIEVLLGMTFLSLSNADVEFTEQPGKLN